MTAKVMPFRKPVSQYMMMNQHNDSYPVDREISEIVHEGLRRIIDGVERKDYIAAANRVIKEALGTNIIIYGELGLVHVTFMMTIKITDFSGLSSALNNDLSAIIDQYGFVDYRKLSRIACNADDERSDAVRRCIALRNTADISWEAHKNVSSNRH
ncbi:MAG: hypothetical protein MRK00_16290 [Nitrosomonas sp.]|nr:hypothetical protein [Nitrosomonas sp.]